MVALNGGNLLVKAVSGLLSAWLVLHYTRTELWGEFTNYWVTLSVLSTISSFGNKEFAIREMSKQPAQADSIWNSCLYSRMFLFLPLVPIFIYCFNDRTILLYASSWLILNFIQQSFESISIFEKKFRLALIIEFLGAGTTLLFLVTSLNGLQGEQILLAFILGQLTRTIVSLIFFQKHILWPKKVFFSFSQLRRLFPFFLLGIGGFLIDKSDLICVNSYLDSSQKASYQILSNICTMGLVAASLVLIPFSKNIYRLNAKTFQRFNNSYAIFGIFFSLAFIAFAFGILDYFYQLNFSLAIYFWFFMNILAYTFFLPKMYFFTQQNEQFLALKLILFAGLCTFLIAFFMVKYHGILGAAFSCAAGQFILLALAYRFVAIRSKFAN